LVVADPGLTIHQIEDRCAFIFWMLRLVENRRQTEPLLRRTTDLKFRCEVPIL
jgi:hypothetical protein